MMVTKKAPVKSKPRLEGQRSPEPKVKCGVKEKNKEGGEKEGSRAVGRREDIGRDRFSEAA